MESPPQRPNDQARALRAFAIAPPVTALVYIITVTPEASTMFVSARTVGPQFALVVAALRFYLVLGVVLAAVVLYGGLAYSVSQRTGEIGLRMALGAAPGDVFRLILSQGGRLAAIGLVLGLAGAFAAGHVVESLLGGVSGADPGKFAAVGAVLGLVALGACFVPALRATRVAPVTALRYE